MNIEGGDARPPTDTWAVAELLKAFMKDNDLALSDVLRAAAELV